MFEHGCMNTDLFGVSYILSARCLYSGVCSCSVQLSVFQMEKNSRNEIIIYTIIIILCHCCDSTFFSWHVVLLQKAKEAKVEQLPEFREFITFASQFVPADLSSHLGADDECGGKGKEEDEKAKVTSRPKKPVPFYDVSHLYVYKTDLKKMESEKQTDGKKRTALSVKTESFISLSSEPTVQLLGAGHSDKDTADITNTKSLSLDTEGSSKTVQPETSTTAKDKDSSADTNSGGPLVGVMGLDVTDAPGIGGPARGRGSAAKGRGGVKRKHTSRAKQWELTFTLAPTNVQTSVSNPSKKKKARKNKKKKNN